MNAAAIDAPLMAGGSAVMSASSRDTGFCCGALGSYRFLPVYLRITSSTVGIGLPDFASCMCNCTIADVYPTSDFKQVTAVAWHPTDPVGPAKVLTEFKKSLEKFVIKAGFQGGVRLDKAGVEALSKMPSMDEMRAQLLGVLQAVPAKLLSQLNAPAQHVVGVIEAKRAKDEKGA